MIEVKFREYCKFERRIISWEELLKDNDCHISILKGDHNFMQYTGLKDKNGVEIYEGDVFWSDYADAYYQVIFSTEYLGFFCETENENVFYDDRIIPLYDQLIEIIGNIHENPELLKGTES